MIKFNKKTKRPTKGIFIVKIIITYPCWNYELNEILYMPIYSSTKYHARLKFRNLMSGSEFPGYNILSIDEVKYPFNNHELLI